MFRKHPESLLVVAGDGEPEYVAGLRAEAERIGLGTDRILWTGFIDGSEKMAALAAATIFVLPSYSENFGIAAAEALAAGIPSVLTDQVALAADAAETDSALVVRCNQLELAHAIDRLLTDRAMRDRLAANAAHMATERFSLATAGRSLKQLYATIRKPCKT